MKVKVPAGISAGFAVWVPGFRGALSNWAISIFTRQVRLALVINAYAFPSLGDL